MPRAVVTEPVLWYYFPVALPENRGLCERGRGTVGIPELLDRLIPGPVRLFYDMTLTAFLRLTGSVTAAVAGLSLVVCLLATPLRPLRKSSLRENGFRLLRMWLLQLVCLIASWQFFSGTKTLQGSFPGVPGGLGQAGGFALFWCCYAAFSLLRRTTGWGYREMALNPRQRKTDRRNRILLACCCLYLAVLTGLMIPSEILSASPAEFIDVHRFRDPGRYLLHAAPAAAGTFILWGTSYGLLLSPKARKRYTAGLLCLAAAAALNYMLFSGNYGIISSALQYETDISAQAGTVALNTLCVAALCAAVLTVFRKWPFIPLVFCLYGCAAMTVLSVNNIREIRTKTEEIRVIASGLPEEKASFRLDRSGKNVVVIMLDRGISGFVPYYLNEKPELARQFDGFTWYPNTLSYGYHTNIAAPALFGGYEYMPDELEKRPETLKEKHNEALKVMPVSFLEKGYEVTVCDAPYANYQWIPDMSIYDDYPAVRTWNTIGMFDTYREGTLRWLDSLRERNLFCHSLFRCAPSLLQPAVYDRGRYLAADDGSGEEDSELYGISADFMNSYTALQNLPAMTAVSDGGRNTFLMLTNEMTHDVIGLQEPDYVPRRHVDNTAYEAEHGIRRTADGKELDIASGKDLVKIHYQSDMAAFLLLGNWFDELRAQGVYDNTRIIIVSDHGCYLGLFGTDLRKKADGTLPDVYHQDEWTDTMCYNPLLLVKDFGASGFTTDTTFMTNADTPSLAFAQTVEEPVNPFTGKPVTQEAKHAPEQHIVESDWHIVLNDGSFFSEPLWITFRGKDVFAPESWSVGK